MTEPLKFSNAELLKQLLDTMDDHIYFKDRESRFIMVNRSFARLLHREPDDLAGKTDFDIFTREHAQPAFDAEQEIIRTGEPLLGLEEEETWTDGHSTWVSTSKMPLRDAAGNIIGTFGISRDITEHKLNEIRMQQYARRLTQINAQMEDELRMAANLQQAFLPQFYPLFPSASGLKSVQFAHRYIANTLISGDLCSIHKLNENEAGMLICDVMGHGVRAALITAILYTMISDLSRRGLPPGKFLSEMNRQLRPMLQSQDVFIFVTASYLVLDITTGDLSGASAGHTVPFCIQRDSTSQVSQIHAVSHVNGPALAVLKNHDYKTFHIKLKPGDTVLMYTDGLTEALNINQEEFGKERAESVIQQLPDNGPDEVCNALINAVSEFQEGTHFEDDVCLLAFRWNGPDEA